MFVDDIDPRVGRAKAKVVEKPPVAFGSFAMYLVDDVEEGFKNPKHRQQWRNTPKTYAEPLFKTRIDQVTTEQILAVLQPIWLTKAETASRLRGRIKRLGRRKSKGSSLRRKPSTWARPSRFIATKARQSVGETPPGMAVHADCNVHESPSQAASRCRQSVGVHNPFGGTLR